MAQSADHTAGPEPAGARMTAAEVFLRRLRLRGIESLIINAGTDTAPIAEVYAERSPAELPAPVLAAHENLAAGMAHGAYLQTGKPQAVLVHVGVGTANTLCAVINAAHDQVPLIVCAGRSPVLESGAPGARDTRIQYGQEMYDQAGILREQVKWDFEVRDPRHLASAVDRAVDLATTPPCGPVYLTLPREMLMETAEDGRNGAQRPSQATGPAPDGDAVRRLVDRVARAELPIVFTTAAGCDPETVALLAELGERFAVGVVEVEPRRMNLPASHPAHLGFSTLRTLLAADVLCFLECPVPWLPGFESPADDAFIAQVGVDPLQSRYPTRGHRADLSITSTSAGMLRALIDGLAAHDADMSGRAARVAVLSERWRGRAEAVATRELAADGPITKAFASATLAEFLDVPGRVLFNEYWARPDLLQLRTPGSYFYLPLSGGLGWAIPAAVGARHADPGCSPIAAVGDGTYLFSNPAACHHAARKHDAPFLTLIADNGGWGAVSAAATSLRPDGPVARTRATHLSDLSPTPDLERYVEASGGFGLRVSTRQDLRGALKAGLSAVETDGRQAVIRFDCAD